MDMTEITSDIKSVASSKTNPLQAEIEFVFTDFKPNKNKEGVPETEVDNIINTGKYMPVKTLYTKAGVQDHEFSLPIGTIVDLQHEEDKIIGRALIWKDEFKDLVNYLASEIESLRFPQISWELYSYTREIKDNVTWLKDIVVAAATIVKNPAYNGRTPVRSIAESANDSTTENIPMDDAPITTEEQVVQTSFVDDVPSVELTPSLDDDYVTVQPDELYEELKAQYTQLELQFNEATTQLAELQTQHQQLNEELTALRAFKQAADEAEAAQLEAAKKQKRKDRVSKCSVNFDNHEKFIMGLSDEDFENYIATLPNAEASVSTASVKVQVPNFIAPKTPFDPVQTLAGFLKES